MFSRAEWVSGLRRILGHLYDRLPPVRDYEEFMLLYTHYDRVYLDAGARFSCNRSGCVTEEDEKVTASREGVSEIVDGVVASVPDRWMLGLEVTIVSPVGVGWAAAERGVGSNVLRLLYDNGRDRLSAMVWEDVTRIDARVPHGAIPSALSHMRAAGGIVALVSAVYDAAETRGLDSMRTETLYNTVLEELESRTGARIEEEPAIRGVKLLVDAGSEGVVERLAREAWALADTLPGALDEALRMMRQL